MILRKGSKGSEVKALQRALHLLDDGIFGQLTEEAVKEFQKSKGLKVDGIVGDATWAAINDSSLSKSKRSINEIIVHCTATPEGKPCTVADITNWHKQRGFTTIGYHYVIYLDGSIHKGRDINVSGAHCVGHNSHSIGVCYVGGLENKPGVPTSKQKEKDTRTPAQKASMLKLLKELRTLYPMAKIHGHKDFANKACPSFDATKEYKSI